MAQQLLKQGEKVAFLGLFMSYDPTGNFLRRIQSHLEQFRVMRTRAKLADLTKNSAEKVRSMLWRLIFKVFRHRLPPLFRNVSEMNLQAVRDYAPKVYPGRMTAFLNGRVPAEISLDPDLSLFGMQAHEVQLRVFPGDGGSMFQEPFVGEMAEQLRTCLKDAAAIGSAETQNQPQLRPNLPVLTYS
jgi:thioesterase domain-containing protein